MDKHELATRRRFLCHACGYDMAGREEGDPCPECATAFDRRPDLAGAEARSKRGIGYMVAAMLVLFILPPLTFVFFFLAHRVYTWLDPVRHEFRIPYHIRRRRRMIKLLVYAWAAEFFAFFWIDAIWPPFMDWVSFNWLF